MNRLHCLALGLLLPLALAARASDTGDFHDALADTWRFYRGAVFYLGTGNHMVAGFELEQMREHWDVLQQRFAADPPDPYSDDPRFAEVLEESGARVQQALAATAAGDADTASRTLAPLRGELAALRARAGVHTFSDCVGEANAAMDALYVYRAEPPALDDAAAVNEVKARTAVLRYVLRRCDRRAPPAVQRDPEFRRIVDGSLASLEQLFVALDGSDPTTVVNLLRELRSFDRILFLRFG